MVGHLMQAAHWVIKGLTFDAHHSHRFLKDVLMGSFELCSKDLLSQIPWFSDLVYQQLPDHHLPRLPLALCLHQEESIWCLPGTCHSIKLLTCRSFSHLLGFSNLFNVLL